MVGNENRVGELRALIAVPEWIEHAPRAFARSRCAVVCVAALVVLWRTGPDTVSRSVRGITGVSRPRNCLNWSFLGVKVMYILVPRLPHQSGQSGKTTRRFGVNCSIRRKKHPMRLTTRWDLVDRYYGKSLQIPKVVGLR